MVQDRGSLGYYSDGTAAWLDSDLQGASGLEGELLITQLPDDVLERVDELLEDRVRIERADLSFPVIITPDGTLADGYHRVARAILANSSVMRSMKGVAEEADKLLVLYRERFPLSEES